MRRPLTFVALLCGFVFAISGSAAADTHCRNFTVGKANSSSYPGGKLPARKVYVNKVSCKKIRRLARGLQAGEVYVPETVTDDLPSGVWSEPFRVSDQALQWHCRYMRIGSSGPSYKFRCSWNSRRARWSVG